MPAAWKSTSPQLEGVLEATVSYTQERARVRYIPTLVSQADLRKAVSAAGFEAIQLGGEAEDAERLARQKEIAEQKRLLIIGVIFTLPLFILAMGRDFGLWGMWAHSSWVNWLMAVLATPVQFYVGWQYYVGAFKSLRNGSANMDVLDRDGIIGSLFLFHSGAAGIVCPAMSTLRPAR